MKRVALILPALALSGCGAQVGLAPKPGASLPVKSAMAARPATADELLTPPTLARPDRVDELLTKSEPRQTDRFDLPPSSVGPGGQTVPVEPAEQPSSSVAPGGTPVPVDSADRPH